MELKNLACGVHIRSPHSMLLLIFILPASLWGGGCLSGASQPLSIGQVADTAAKAGFKGESLAEAIAIAYGESGFVADCVSENGDGTRDYGLWQMNNDKYNLFSFGPSLEFGDTVHGVNQDAVKCALQPACNADYTYQLWRYGGPNKGGPGRAFNSTKWHAFGGQQYKQKLVAAQIFLKSNPGRYRDSTAIEAERRRLMEQQRQCGVTSQVRDEDCYRSFYQLNDNHMAYSKCSDDSRNENTRCNAEVTAKLKDLIGVQ